MKKILLAALAALTLFGSMDAQAGSYSIKTTSLVWQRTDNAVNSSSQISTFLSDGNHTAAGRGVAVPVQDTSSMIDITDHFWRRLVLSKATFPGTGVGSDSTFFGVLTLHGTASSIDTVNVFRDTSIDGLTWVVVDSAAYHISTPQWAAGITAAGSDSLRYIFSTRTNMGGSTESNSSTVFSCYPGMPNVGISGMGISDVRFIRFRIHLSPGDYAAAGAGVNGVTGQFLYPIEQ